MWDTDITIIGAGVIGLALARELARNGHPPCILDQEPGPGRGTSSRNSEVIHGGIYYPEHYLKTRLCVRGAPELYTFCEDHAVPCRRLGKLIVAADEDELPALEHLTRQAEANGVRDLRILSRAELRHLEPHVAGAGALFSPHTGILDSHRLTRALELSCLDHGADAVYHTTVEAITPLNEGFKLHARTGQETYPFTTRVLINAAGLSADHVAALAGLDLDEAGCRLRLVKGEYFRLTGGHHQKLNHLIYPSPQADLTGLGIHVTKDLAGQVRLGPNTVPVDTPDYDVDPDHREAFFLGVNSFLPWITRDDLTPDMAGIRPKLIPAADAPADFIIRHEPSIPGLINLVGMESPGLTSCLAVAEMVREMMRDDGLI